ncbi:MAG: VWA domain-containing protein [Ignavibacteriales bacterium]|jgi:hypothetical protein|nr:MAG: VWA domain-containing protein [Ignavibacteriales bacterium]
MSQNVELVFILDRSGSMSGLEKDTIGGFNGVIEKQKKLEGDCLVSTVLFDDRFEVLHNRKNLKEIKPMTEKDYYVRGCTALLDAMGRSITKIAQIHRHLSKEERPEKVLFVITTDGLENASREYSYADIKKMITIETEEYGWEFIFLGANIDSFNEADRLGIKRSRVANFHNDKKGTETNYEALHEAINEFRSFDRIEDHWNEKINADYIKRKKS